MNVVDLSSIGPSKKYRCLTNLQATRTNKNNTIWYYKKQREERLLDSPICSPTTTQMTISHLEQQFTRLASNMTSLEEGRLATVESMTGKTNSENSLLVSVEKANMRSTL
jgi:hypothetical protein